MSGGAISKVCGTDSASGSVMQQHLSPSLTIEDHFELRQRLIATLDELNDQLKQTNDAIKDEMCARGIEDYVIGDDRLVLSVREGRKTLDRAALIFLGVPEETIAQATKQGEPYTQLDVRRVGE